MGGMTKHQRLTCNYVEEKKSDITVNNQMDKVVPSLYDWQYFKRKSVKKTVHGEYSLLQGNTAKIWNSLFRIRKHDL